jgi:SAM-dependent methyltransferase
MPTKARPRIERKSQPVLEETCCDVCGSTDRSRLIEVVDGAYCECGSCGLVYANPMPSNLTELNEEDFSARFDGYAAKIDSRRAAYRRRLKPFSRYRQTGNLLEIGCSTGALLAAARDLGWQVKGVEPNTITSAYARDELGLDVITGTVETAGLEENFFDLVYSQAVLEHVRHPLATLKESLRVLRPGGIFYAETVNWDSYTRRLLGEHWKYLAPTSHVHLFTPRNVITLCEHAGLEHVQTRTTGVRVEPHQAEGYTTPWHHRLAKSPLSLLSRVTLRGDNIKFWARKSEG